MPTNAQSQFYDLTTSKSRKITSPGAHGVLYRVFMFYRPTPCLPAPHRSCRAKAPSFFRINSLNRFLGPSIYPNPDNAKRRFQNHRRYMIAPAFVTLSNKHEKGNTCGATMKRLPRCLCLFCFFATVAPLAAPTAAATSSSNNNRSSSHSSSHSSSRSRSSRSGTRSSRSNGSSSNSSNRSNNNSRRSSRSTKQQAAAGSRQRQTTKNTQTKKKRVDNKTKPTLPPPLPPNQKKTNQQNPVYYGAQQPKYVAAVNQIPWRPESLVLISLCMNSLGADRRGAGNLHGNSGLRPEFPS